MDYLDPVTTPVYSRFGEEVGYYHLLRYNWEMPDVMTLRQEAATQIDTRLQRIKKFLDETMPASKYSKPNSSAGEDAAKQSCPICIEDLCVDDDVRTLTCKHLFHKDCIDKWFRKKTDCPICRQNILVNEYELIH